jgi:hypothetical protein
VTLESGYKAGRPAAGSACRTPSRGSWAAGRSSCFAVDFEGKNEVRIPLAATGITREQARRAGAFSAYAVCVRNMFEEERAGNPGLLEVLVEGADGASGLGRLIRGLKSFFGA